MPEFGIKRYQGVAMCSKKNIQKQNKVSSTFEPSHAGGLQVLEVRIPQESRAPIATGTMLKQ